MASTNDIIAAQTPLPANPGSLAVPLSTTPPIDENRPLKRQRDTESTSPRSLPAHHINLLGSPTKSARLALATANFPVPLTGAAALEDERRRQNEDQESSAVGTSENPSHKALISLMSGGVQAMSRPADGPQLAPTANMEVGSRIANDLSTGASRGDDHAAASPQSPMNIAGALVTTSPTPMDVDNRADDHTTSQEVATHDERPQPGSLSYPGSLQSTGNLAEPPVRGMSFPMPSQSQGSPTPSTAKKHKCPYCNTEFTRHHNLKSHLLTHSQEKPYVCTHCQMRFRRLHDLKRHGKLHTGEKPHICPKCDRKFARGDALARHSKGAGGCAGRRSSMGSFADGDELDGGLGDGDESTMSGIAYDASNEEGIRRQSLPSISAQNASGSQSENYGTHSRTYPPAGPRSGTGGLYPPNVSQTQSSTNAGSSAPDSMASGHTPNTSISSIPVGGGSAGMYSQTGMTESPKPLSPGIQIYESSNHARQRSPGLSQQVQQQQIGRRQPELQSPHNGPSRPKLPGLSHPGFAASGSVAHTHTRTPTGPQTGNDSGNMFAQSDPGVWDYIQSLEEKVKALSDKVTSLDYEVVGLKKQLDVRDGATTE